MNLTRPLLSCATSLLASFLIALPAALCAAPAAAAAPPLLLRYPSLSQNTIAFRYSDDIWTVARTGGEAQRLTSSSSVNEGPYFSPDGSQIAYSARIHGNTDVYVIPASGGIPRRITWHPAGSFVVGWTPDGKDVLVSSMMSSFRHYLRLYRVHADGSGVPEPLPLPAGFEGSYSPDGQSIAYESISRWQDAWKRYHGGQNFPIWIVNLKTLDLVKIPSDNTKDTNPVWIGDQIYFLSDRADAGKTGAVSLFRYDTQSKQVTPAVPNTGLDLKSIQAGPGGLVYEQFGSLHLLDLPSASQPGQDHTLEISIHGDLPHLAPHLASITADEIQNAALSPTGQRAVIEAHGDIFTVPAEKGDTRNLTNTSNAGIDLSSLDRAQTSAAYVVVLSKDEASPLPPESDDEKIKDEKKQDDKNPKPPTPPKTEADDKNKDKKDTKADTKSDDKDKDAKKEDKTEDKKVEVKVDLDGIGNRILSLPIPARNYGGLVIGKTGVIYLLEGPPVGRTSSESGGPGIRAVWRFTLEKRKTEQVLSDLDNFLVSADASKALLTQHNSFSIVATDDLKPGDGGSGKPLKLSNMTANIDPRAEWRQIFHETWRIERDFFYDPNTHGLSIPKIEARYSPYLDGLSTRSEFSYLSTEMLGEITVGHMFLGGPFHPDNSPKTGLLGADYTVENNRYRIRKILGGQNWTPGLASPLTLPGVYVKEGEYLLAVNGKELHATDNLYQFFDGTAGLQTVLHVGPNPDGKNARDVTAVPIGDEDGLRNLDWIESNRRKVDKLSGGKVAYVYMPNTGGSGYTNFNRYFYSQLDKQALVLDERYNEGGFIADYVVDVLRRQPLSGAIERDGKPLHDPVGAIFGPKAMLINQDSGSGGDAMPWYFRKAGLGKLVGTRTWGGLVGIGGYPTLLDGGRVTAPRFAIYGLSGDWEVENHGITPDVPVEDTPKDFMAGHDLQLETGVNLVLEELKAHPVPAIPIPPYPNYHPNDGLGKN